MVGLLEDATRRVPQGLREEGDFVLLVGDTHSELGGSEYSRVMHNHITGHPPALDLQQEVATQEFILEAANAGLLTSAHDVADGGLLVALAESCLAGGVGVRGAALHPDGDVRLDAMFFGESQSRFIVSTHSRALPELQTLARRAKVDLMLIGLAGGDRIELRGQVDVSLAELREAWEGGLERAARPAPPSPDAIEQEAGA
jgi:phosphoribosylformylglycinamidine synthase